jgi:hypothetical protein
MLSMHAHYGIACNLAGRTAQLSYPGPGHQVGSGSISCLSLSSLRTSVMQYTRVTLHVLEFLFACMHLVSAQAVFALRLGSNGSRFAACGTRKTFFSTSTARLHAQLHRTAPSPVFAIGSEAEAAPPAPQIAIESFASPPESEAPQFPLSATVVAAAAAALAAGRDVLKAAAAVDRFDVELAAVTAVGAFLWPLVFPAAAPLDPIVVVGTPVAIWFFHRSAAAAGDHPRVAALGPAIAALGSASRAVCTSLMAYALTGVFLPVR